MLLKKTYIALLAFLLFALVTTLFLPFAGATAAGTKYEMESNNSYSIADRTYSDYDSYGLISSSSDVDWWKVSFNCSGTGCFWLGNIPASCDYDMQLYASNGTTLLASSSNGSGQAEYIQYSAVAGTTYYIKIYSYSGYSTSSSYLFRPRLYNDLNVSLIAQETSYTCGAASIRMIYDYYGLSRTEQQVITIAQNVSGLSDGYQYQPLHGDILNAYTNNSVLNVCYSYRSSSPKSSLSANDYKDVVNHNSADSYPMIVLVGIRNNLNECNTEHFGYTSGGHFLVITGVDSSGNVHINDPYSAQEAWHAQYVSLPVDCLRNYTYATNGPYEFTSVIWP